MAIIDPKMEGFSNHTSARPLELNSCGKQYLSDRDYEMLRKDGRVDYHILYIAAGRCYIEENEEKRAVEAGNLIVFYPYERQYYSFRKGEGSVSCYIHFSGVACEQLLKNRIVCELVDLSWPRCSLKELKFVIFFICDFFVFQLLRQQKYHRFS